MMEPRDPLFPPPEPDPPAWPARDGDHLLVSGAQMAALEEELFASGLPVEALMEKAALAVSRRLLEGPLPRPGHPLAAGVVLVGPRTQRGRWAGGGPQAAPGGCARAAVVPL